MKQDPLEALDSFYEACRDAPEPERRQPRRSPRFAVPLFGAAIGIAAAVILATFPSEPSAAACKKTLQSLAARQLATPQPPESRFEVGGREAQTMDRLKLWLIPVYALAGFFLVVAFMPKTSWILKVQKDVLSGSWNAHDGPMDDQNIGSPAPKQLGPTPEDTATDDTTTFLKLMDACWHSANLDGPIATTERDRRFKLLFDFCKRQNTAAYWAQFVRADSMDAHVSDMAEPTGLPGPFNRTNTRKLLLQACDSGASLDPQNAFFPAMKACALYVTRDAKGSSALFKVASKENKFEEYMNLEPDLQYEWFVNRFGYLGNQIKIYILDFILYPHFAPIKNLARRLIQTGRPEESVAAMRLGGLLMNKSSSIIGMFVGRAIVSCALQPEQRRGTYHEVPDDKVRSQTAKLQSMVPDAGDLAQIASDYIRLKPPYAQFDQDDTNQYLGAANLLDTAWPLIVVLLLPISFLGLLVKARFPRLCTISPYLIWSMCLAIGYEVGQDSGPTLLFAALVLLAIPASYERPRRVTDVFAIMLAVAAIFVAFGLVAYPLLVPASLFIGLLALERLADRIPSWVTALAFIAVLFVAGAVLVSLLTLVGYERAWLGCIGVIVAGLAVVPVRGEFRWQPFAGVASLVVLLVFGYSISRGMARDKALGKALAMWDHEVADIRGSRSAH